MSLGKETLHLDPSNNATLTACEIVAGHKQPVWASESSLMQSQLIHVENLLLLEISFDASWHINQEDDYHGVITTVLANHHATLLTT